MKSRKPIIIGAILFGVTTVGNETGEKGSGTIERE
tara:strand:+ start:404 stop:508 length:105 start_codon:yes stop_codon:yes gene_type:complete